MRLSNDIWVRSRFCRTLNSEKSENGPTPWTFWHILIKFCIPIYYYWHDLNREIAKSSPRDCKMTFNIGRGCAELQILKEAEVSALLWWNFAYTLILTRCSPRDCQMSFGIGRGVAVVQILKNSETGPISWIFLNILIKLCINIAIAVS